MNIGERVKEVRKTLNLTQEEFAGELGVTRGAIAKIEIGNRNLTKQMAKAISREYDINYIWLTEGSGKMFDSTSNIPDSLGGRIAELRSISRLSQELFGAKLGVGKAAISKLEKSENNPSERTLKLICKEYNVNYEWLVNGTGDMLLPDSLVDNLIAKYELSETGASLIKNYLLLTKNEQEVIEKYLRNVFTSD